MHEFITYSGYALTVVSFGGNMIQGFFQLLNRGLRQKETRNLTATKASLMQLRRACTEASEIGEVIKTEAVKQFVRGIGHQVKTIEHQVDAMLGIGPDPRRLAPAPESDKEQSRP